MPMSVNISRSSRFHTCATSLTQRAMYLKGPVIIASFFYLIYTGRWQKRFRLSVITAATKGNTSRAA